MRSTEPDQPLDPDDLGPELQEALRRMSARGDGPVIDLGTGAIVAKDGHLVGDLVACRECARAVALGWWGSTARHCSDPDSPVCQLCSEGEATLTAEAWFALTLQLTIQNTASGTRRTWRDDAIKGLGAIAMPEPPG
ncbi:hypothetical protein FNV58_00885 (plasmid) [Streptomyces sp. RLB1-9]|uniref:hypothetical protein n=1 Tax=Streptomyces sp. RLB1-9 TaxID=2594454 RepID=UPI0011623E5F|nr:hypothetical protein [Streptomyces sp. RLB1-9]QDN94915.1 hypothetical protein FNV58_00885 [Streptomyces sp. RLB1-9]